MHTTEIIMPASNTSHAVFICVTHIYVWFAFTSVHALRRSVNIDFSVRVTASLHNSRSRSNACDQIVNIFKEISGTRVDVVEKEVFRFLEEFSKCQYTGELLEWKIRNLIFKLLSLNNSHLCP